jgi:hypothetical protein
VCCMWQRVRAIKQSTHLFHHSGCCLAKAMTSRSKETATYGPFQADRPPMPPAERFPSAPNATDRSQSSNVSGGCAQSLPAQRMADLQPKWCWLVR